MHFLDCKQFALHEDLNRGLTWLYTSINNLNKNIEALQTARHNCEDSFVFREDYMLTQSSKSHTADNTPKTVHCLKTLCVSYGHQNIQSHLWDITFLCFSLFAGMFSGCVAAAKAVKKDRFLFECNRDDDGKDSHTLTTHPLKIAVNQVPLATVLLQGRKWEFPDGPKRGPFVKDHMFNPGHSLNCRWPEAPRWEPENPRVSTLASEKEKIGDSVTAAVRSSSIRGKPPDNCCKDLS